MKKNTLKRVIASLTIAATLSTPITALAEERKPADIYPETLIVTWADHEAELIGLTDSNNYYHYTVETAAGDWQPGDIVSVIKTTNGTKTRSDDWIATEYGIHYAGRLEKYAKIIGRYTRKNISIVYRTAKKYKG